MKKSLFILASAALVLASCNNDVKIDENVGLADGNQQKEIAFSPYAVRPNRAPAYQAVSNDVFPDNYVMQVSANINALGAYFHDVTFAKDGATWKGTPKQYWPLSPATLNLLAVTEWPSTYSKDIVNTTFTNSKADGATVVLGDNKPAVVNSQAGSQHDLMYAVGRGIVAQNGNVLYYSGNAAGDEAPIAMTFKHALAWVNFTAKANVSGFTLRSITLKDAYYGGTYTIINDDNKNYTYDGSTYTDKTPTAVTGTWSLPTNKADVAVPGWSANTIAVDPAAATEIGTGLMVVPTNGIGATKSFTGFEIAYTFNGKELTYEYNNEVVLEQAKKYTYAINFTLTEIEINPSVTAWTGVTPATDVNIPIVANYLHSTTADNTGNYPQVGNIPATAGTYTFTVGGLTSTTNVTVAEVTGGTGTLASVSHEYDAANKVVTVTFEVPVSGGSAKTYKIDVTDSDTYKTTITVNQAAE